MATFRYTKSHEYVKQDDGAYFLGITEHAQGQLGDITFVELPAVGAKFSAGQACCTVESVKAVAEVYAPFDLEVTGGNSQLDDQPELINKDAHGEGWLINFMPTDPAAVDGLMDQAAYDAMEK
ncbi:MAG: glycine cleavage system protein GcvH [bacterium]|nr:glycine cleavage system protein GcvH [bacterium]